MSDRLDKRHAKIVSEAARERETNAYVSLLQSLVLLPRRCYGLHRDS